MKKLLAFSFILLYVWGGITFAQEIASFKAHTKSYGILDAVFSPNGKNILTSGRDGTAQWWDLAGKNLQTFKTTAETVHSIAVSPDGKSAILGTSDSQIQVWDIASATMKKEWKCKNIPYHLIFSPNGKYLLAVGNYNMIELWENGTWKSLLSLQGRGIQCQEAGFSPDSKSIVTGCGTKLHYWEIPSGKVISTFDDLEFEPANVPKPSGINKALFSKDGKLVLTIYDGDYNAYTGNPRIELWDLTGKRIQKFEKITGGVSAVLSPDQQYVLAGASHYAFKGFDQSNGMINLWNVSEGKLLALVPAHENGIQKITFSPDGKTLMTIGEKDREVKLWDAEKLLATRNQNENKSLNNPTNNSSDNNTEFSMDDFESFVKSANPKYYALIISVQDYQDKAIKDLTNPEKDAEKLSFILQKNYTFDTAETMILKNPKRADIINALDKLSQIITEKDNLLIFYAGHGYWDEKLEQGYWLPSDAQKDYRANWLANSELANYIRGIRTKHTLLVTDACFGGSIFEATRSAFDNAPAHIRNLYERNSRKAMTSGAKEEVPDKSVFTEYLLDALETNEKAFYTASELFNYVLEPVSSNTRNAPQFGIIQNTKHEGGDFIFIKR